MIEFSNVCINWSGVPILNDFSWRFKKGTLTLIVGPSGTGKSMLCDLIAGNHKPESGTVRIQADQNRTDAIGYVAESLPLLSDRNIEDNISLPLELRSSARGRTQLLVDTIARFGIEHIRLEHPEALSPGLRQKAAIARAVISEPFILVADEPAAHLDFTSAREIAEILIRERARGMTIVVATSDERFASVFPDAERISLPQNKGY